VTVSSWGPATTCWQDRTRWQDTRTQARTRPCL
jgi:hypothetical protein